jgi:hypothetical protein
MTSKKLPRPESDADKQLISVIKKQGWGVIDVSDAPIPFSFTVGLSYSYNHPELLVSGMDIRTSAYVLNVFSDKISKGLVIEDGLIDEDSTGGKFYFSNIAWRELPSYFGTAIWFYGNAKFKAIQCYWADKAGHFPFEPKCRSTVKKMQLNLGEC